MDLCCFHRGIEEIEQMRAWPARSAKLILRFALAALARHYGIGNAATGASPVRPQVVAGLRGQRRRGSRNGCGRSASGNRLNAGSTGAP